MNKRTGNSRPFEDSGDFWGFGRQSYVNEEERYMQVAANYINNGHYSEAINILGQIENKRVEVYLSGYAIMVGNNGLALEHAKTAVQMEPYITVIKNLLV